MSKKLFTTFRAAVDSFPLGEQNVGLLKPGRYNGYDVMVTAGALDITISHSGTIKKTGKDNLFLPNFGALMFGTGIILHDEDEINLTVSTNSGNANDRIDYLIAENSYQEIPGGTPVIYSIIQGPGNGEEPTLSNPAKQILIAKIKINANGYLFTDLTYTVQRTPLPGDLTYNQLTNIINQVVVIPEASYTQKGIAMKATQTKVDTGTDEETFITPKGLHNKKATQTTEGIVRMANPSENLLGESDNLAVSAKQWRGKGKMVSLTSNYTLTAADYGKIFVGNGTGPITVTVPSGLPSDLHFGFIFGLSTIKLVGGPNVVLKAAPNKLLEIRDINSTMLLESDVNPNNYFVMGNLKNV